MGSLHYNEVKSEYLIFCSNCNKKLENNYSDWSNRNSDKTFEDFKEIICTTEKFNKNTNKPKVKGLKYWIGFTVAFAIFYAIGQLGGEKIAELFRKPAFDKALMEVAKEINKSCPIMVDNETRLDNSIALPDKVFQYNYTLISTLKDSIDIEVLKSYLEPNLKNFVKTNPDMQTMRENKTTLKYYYKDMNGSHILTITVRPEDYE
jgi:acetyltransferase-like isoleucine patch superfamily enzyme